MNDPLISNAFVTSGAYRDLIVPKLIASGKSLTPFYINAEKLCPGIEQALKAYDQAQKKKKNQVNAHLIIEHSLHAVAFDATFREIILHMADVIWEINEEYLMANPAHKMLVITGGERRDWVFSAPLAKVLDASHILFYKPRSLGYEDQYQYAFYNGRMQYFNQNTSFAKSGYYGIHVTDMITKGSSLYDTTNGQQPTGWLAQAAAFELPIPQVVSVVSRKQGGEEHLARFGIPTYAFVTIDEAFLQKHSKDPEQAIAYLNDEETWTKQYLIKNGIECLLEYFNPESKDIAKGIKFFQHYKEWLQHAELLPKLEKAVSQEYKIALEQIIALEKQ
ncbi:MAG: hypothetical protein QW594_01605 [Candidatus Woesearchaeota archaeon]